MACLELTYFASGSILENSIYKIVHDFDHPRSHAVRSSPIDRPGPRRALGHGPSRVRGARRAQVARPGSRISTEEYHYGEDDGGDDGAEVASGGESPALVVLVVLSAVYSVA